jgi:iron complex transport system substrate-binding protein
VAVRSLAAWWLVALVVLVTFALACERGAPPTVAGGELRIVSLTPSATEVVAALGATDKLVGVDQYSDYPPEVATLPKVGSFLVPNLEQILLLRPSFVLVDDVHARTTGSLRDAGIDTVECAMHGLPDVRRALRGVGARIGQAERAERLVAAIDTALDAAAAKRPARRPRVLAIIDREAGGIGNLVGAGPGSWLDELLAVVGGDNVLVASGVRYPKLSIEEVLRAAPEVILDLSYEGKTSVAPWQRVDVPATRTGRVIGLWEPYLVAPSPRVEAALAALSRALAR